MQTEKRRSLALRLLIMPFALIVCPAVYRIAGVAVLVLCFFVANPLLKEPTYLDIEQVEQQQTPPPRWVTLSGGELFWRLAVKHPWIENSTQLDGAWVPFVSPALAQEWKDALARNQPPSFEKCRVVVDLDDLTIARRWPKVNDAKLSAEPTIATIEGQFSKKPLSPELVAGLSKKSARVEPSRILLIGHELHPYLAHELMVILGFVALLMAGWFQKHWVGWRGVLDLIKGRDTEDAGLAGDMLSSTPNLFRRSSLERRLLERKLRRIHEGLGIRPQAGQPPTSSA